MSHYSECKKKSNTYFSHLMYANHKHMLYSALAVINLGMFITNTAQIEANIWIFWAELVSLAR